MLIAARNQNYFLQFTKEQPANTDLSKSIPRCVVDVVFNSNPFILKQLLFIVYPGWSVGAYA